ncbi:response regulator [Fusibacter sp. JL298sf-3]
MGKKVLVVDDAMFMRKMISDILTKAGYEVVAEASNGDEAFAKYKEHQPDLVTMDITMPDVNGIEGVKKIVAAYPEAKVLMCSAMGQETMVIESVKAGAKGFLVKPFVAEKVLSEVEKLLG